MTALIYSKEEEHRALAVRKILDSRINPILVPKHEEKDGLRINVISTINFKCQEWLRLVNIVEVDCFQPPCVEEFNDELLKHMIENRTTPNF